MFFVFVGSHEARLTVAKWMLKNDLAEKENIPIKAEVINGDESHQLEPSWASILKPTRKSNLIEFSPNPNVVTKSSSKVTFKNTPVRHRPPRYQFEELPPCWEELRKLDEEENWTERTSVVTKEEHQEYLEAAKVFLEELITNLPCIREEDITPQKMSSDSGDDGTPKRKPRQRFVKPVRPKGQPAGGDFFIDFGLGGQPVGDDSSAEPSTVVTEEKPVESEIQETVPLEVKSGGDIESLTNSLEGLNLSGKSELDDSNRLQVYKDGSPKTFSPIGSERTSPESENLIGSNEDISKLLMPHDDVAENGTSPQLESSETPLSPGHADELLQQITSLKSQTSELANMFASETSELDKKSTDGIDDASLESSEKTGLESSTGDGKASVPETTDKVETAIVGDSTSAESGVAKGPNMFDDSCSSEAKTNEPKESFKPEDQSDEVFGLTDDDFKSTGDAFSLELDFLEQCGTSGDINKLSALARQSLYVKFDPLVKGANSPQMRPGALLSSKGDDLLQMNTPPNQRPRLLVERLEAMKKEKEDTHVSPQGVDRLLSFSPAPKVPSADATDDVVKVNQTTAEPAFASTSGEDSKRDPAADESHLVQPLLYCKADLEVERKKEREAVLAQVHEESAIREMEIQELQKKLQQQVKDNEGLKQLMLEYEKTMAEMIESGQKSQSEHNKSTESVRKERDQLQADLNSVEAAFSDLHRRYEKLKGAIENYKKNEQILLKTTKDYQEKLKKAEEKYLMLKKHAEEKIECANVEISRVRKSNESEMAVMKAALKKEQTRNLSLEQSLQQKVSENKELTAICDELIGRMGGK